MLKKPKKFYKKAGNKASRTNGSKQVQAEKQFPKNNRAIAEDILGMAEIDSNKARFFSFRTFVFALIGILLLTGIGYLAIQLKRQLLTFEQTEAQRKQLEAKFLQLQETAVIHPGSRDIYLQLASISYQLKDIQNARKFAERALVLDPNYQPSVDLSRKLGN